MICLSVFGCRPPSVLSLEYIICLLSPFGTLYLLPFSPYCAGSGTNTSSAAGVSGSASSLTLATNCDFQVSRGWVGGFQFCGRSSRGFRRICSNTLLTLMLYACWSSPTLLILRMWSPRWLPAYLLVRLCPFFACGVPDGFLHTCLSATLLYPLSHRGGYPVPTRDGTTR